MGAPAEPADAGVGLFVVPVAAGVAAAADSVMLGTLGYDIAGFCLLDYAGL